MDKYELEDALRSLIKDALRGGVPSESIHDLVSYEAEIAEEANA